jgi:MarC family membrane protein
METTVLSAVVTLFLVMDPLGNLPLFMAALKEVDPGRKQKIIVRELFIAFFVLVFFLFFGRFFLTLLQVDTISLTIAGGIILFLIALKLIFPKKDEAFFEGPKGEPFIVPLAIPLIAGPSAMSVILIMVTREPSKIWQWLLAVVIAFALNMAILLFSVPISKVFGKRGLIALERLMGMILSILSVQMIIDGVAQLLTK